MTIDIPEAFVASTIKREGSAGRDWLKGLPDSFEKLAKRWSLTIDGKSMHGYLALAVPVLRKSEKQVLKISWIDRYSEHEALALKEWDGNGAVHLFEADDEGATLLERLDSETDLQVLAPDKAIEIAGLLLRRLSVPAPDWARSVSEEVSDIKNELPEDWESTGRPFSRSLLERTLTLLNELDPPKERLLVNHDLHYENVLAGSREPWLVIDPKVFEGDPEYAVAPLLWQDFAGIDSKAVLDRRLAILIEAADLDSQRARLWAYVRVVSNWLWSLKGGFTEDAARCGRLAGWL